MNVIVTGCNGKLGRVACETLIARGHSVVGLDAASAGPRPHRVVIDTLLDPYAMHRLFDSVGGTVHAIIHLANHTNSRVAPPETVLRENLAMNSNVFLAAWNARVPRLVFSSSVQAMLPHIEADGSVGETRIPPTLPVNESLPARPSNVYGLSKLLTERMLDELCNPDCFRGGSSSAISLRLPYILGPREFDWTVERIGPGERHWGGPEAFAYIAVEDAAEAVVAAVTAPVTGHEVVWVSAPDPRPSEPVSSLLERFFAGVPGREVAASRDSLHDCSKAQQLLGWQPTKTLRAERLRRGLIQG